jgi:hypothetical protein
VAHALKVIQSLPRVTLTAITVKPRAVYPEKYRVVLVPKFQPVTLGRAPEPFSHPDWLFELKFDGFRALGRIEQGKCRLVSRKGNDFKSFRKLTESLLAELKVRSAVLDGEIVCLNDEGKPEFRELLFRRVEARFVAFDLLWCDGQDLRYNHSNQAAAQSWRTQSRAASAVSWLSQPRPRMGVVWLRSVNSHDFVVHRDNWNFQVF